MNIFLLLLLLPLATQGATNSFPAMPSVPPGGTLNFNVYLTNTQDATSANRTQVITNQVEKRIGRTPLLDAVKNKAALQQLQLTNLNSASKSFLDTYQWHLLIGGSLAGYALLCYCIVRGNYYLDQQNLWSSWRAELPLEQLLAIPQEQLGQELVAEIQRKYNTEGIITDVVLPFSHFLKDIEEEEAEIKWYQELYSWLTFLHVQQIVPANAVRYGKIKQRLQRIAYYKNIFKTWSANYKIEQLAVCKKCCGAREYADVATTAALIKKSELRMMHSRTLQALMRYLPEYK